MAIDTTWLIGSFTTSAATTFTVAGTPHDLAAGTRYLYDPTSSLSLIDGLEGVIQTEVAGASVRVGRDRKVRIDFDGTPTTITIPEAVREALGFTAPSYGPVTTLEAENVSGLLWSPGWPVTTSGSPTHAAGRRRHDRVMTASPTGQSFDVTSHGYVTVADWSWQPVKPGRAWTASEAPGEYFDFFERVIVPGYRLKRYDVIEDEADAQAVTWGSPLGPYVVRAPEYEWYQRFVRASDSLGVNISITPMVTAEIS